MLLNYIEDGQDKWSIFRNVSQTVKLFLAWLIHEDVYSKIIHIGWRLSFYLDKYPRIRFFSSQNFIMCDIQDILDFIFFFLCRIRERKNRSLGKNKNLRMIVESEDTLWKEIIKERTIRFYLFYFFLCIFYWVLYITCLLYYC